MGCSTTTHLAVAAAAGAAAGVGFFHVLIRMGLYSVRNATTGAKEVQKQHLAFSSFPHSERRRQDPYDPAPRQGYEGIFPCIGRG